ncbi:MAG: hypothetical protein M2R45_01869 [Verrucomicrobia subdivision 3 bacterium]|nr:hypothetical protein [Limisphaerales bacterium]MCS1415669.1 hypothetical protein [Limisphaerales bacterium]
MAMKSLRILAGCSGLVGLLVSLVSVGAQGTLADCERAEGLRKWFGNLAFRTKGIPIWIGKGDLRWYRVQIGLQRFEFVYFDAANAEWRLAFDHEAMAEVLRKLFDREVEWTNLPLSRLDFGLDGELKSFQVEGQVISRSGTTRQWEIQEPALEPEVTEERLRRRSRFQTYPRPNAQSSDGRWFVEIRNHNVWLNSESGAEVFRMSFDGNECDGYVGGIYWAPNSSRFAAIRRQVAQEHQVYLIKSSPTDQLQSKLHSFGYLKQGDRVAVAKGHDGKTDVHGIIYRPANFTENREYPVIEHIRAGADEPHVPKDFRAYRATAELARVPEALVGKLHLSDFYQKYLGSDGFPILSSSRVSDYALREADYLIDRMLEGRDDIRKALINLRFRCTVMAYNEFTTDVPEHSDLAPKDFWDRRARGLGATPRRPSVSCGEENLLEYPGDPYRGENILIHEFAHAIHEAVRVIDAGFDDRLETLYQAALEKGLWEGKYASSNRYEYWAECVQSYFDDNRENDHSHNHVDTRDELRAYDSGICFLIDEIFRGNPWRYRPPSERRVSDHLAGYAPADAPTFAWPEHLKDALKRESPGNGKRAIEIVKKNVEGWTVWVDIQLLEGFDEQLGQQALDLLKHQLFGIKLLLSEERIQDLQKVAIRLDRDNQTLRGIQYHPSEQWLIENGHDRRVRKMVHIPQAKIFVSRSLSAVQPRVMLHELAHAYHDQFLGFDDPAVKSAFEQATASGAYEVVMHIKGHETKHYALTNHKEYFAEGTEAYFGSNDFYPYVRSELKQHDPALYRIMQDVWGEL